MTDHRQRPDGAWLLYFADLGFPDVRPLGGGVEGATYLLDPDVVAKVWRPGHPDLELRAAFYAGLRAQPLPWRTPLVLDIQQHRGVTVTYEEALPGGVLSRRDLPRAVADGFVEQTAEVLAALAAMSPFPAAMALPALGETDGLYAGTDSWPAAISALVERRMGKYGPLLRSRFPDVDKTAGRVLAELSELGDPELGIVHGDLFHENVLVAEDYRITAVLDFGFLTCAGDPALDAAIACLIVDQYGPAARDMEQRLQTAVERRAGYRRRDLELYKRVYALVTSAAFSSDGSDGHFPWCVDILRRPWPG